MLKQVNAKAIFAKTEIRTFNQTVLIINMFTAAPISKSSEPIKMVAVKDLFFSEMPLKKIVEISISKKKIHTKAMFIINTISSSNTQTKTYENPFAFLKQ